MITMMLWLLLMVQCLIDVVVGVAIYFVNIYVVVADDYVFLLKMLLWLFDENLLMLSPAMVLFVVFYDEMMNVVKPLRHYFLWPMFHYPYQQNQLLLLVPAGNQFQHHLYFL